MYCLITYIRNRLYDFEILKSYGFPVEIISVGNISVGGTGKTPHTEWLIQHFLSNKKRVAFVSRGYKRKTKGMVVANKDCNAQTIGDEPFQVFCKFPQIKVVVDKDRVRAINFLMNEPEPPEVVILDDAFQYRRLKVSKHIVLIDYNRPIFRDKILPFGRLRESAKAIERANQVIVTKCPNSIDQAEKRFYKERISKNFNGEILFTSFDFLTAKNIFSKKELNNSKKYHYLVVTGVVSPDSLYEYLLKNALSINKLKFGDHHFFSERDTKLIINEFNRLPVDNSVIVVTEKDAARLINNPFLSPDIKSKLFSVEIRVKFV